MSNVEEHIQKAIRDGKFDNLKSKGKKLSLEDNPYVDPEWRLAHHVLHSSGFTLPWIEKRQQLSTEINAARTALVQAWAWRKAAQASRQYTLDVITSEWGRAESTFRETLTQLNKQIRAYNLEAPSEHVHLPLLNADRELARLDGPHQDSGGE